MTSRALRVAVLGAGTVGAEVVRAFQERPDRLRAGDTHLELAGVAVRALGQRRPKHLPDTVLTDAPAHLVARPDVDIVCELMGGDEPARTLIAAALGAGKAVVTANKHVLAHHGAELEAIARKSGAPLRFEASVAGGIPLIGLLGNELAANRIRRVRGIVNGTTNAILSSMEEPGITYHRALRAAQQAGYAEADPRGDVEGDDPANKLVVLTRLAFGRWLSPGSIARRVPTVRGAASPGITAVDANEVTGALALQYTIRLLAAAAAPAEGHEDPHAWVLPTAVSVHGGFGRTRGVLNHVEIESDLVERLAFSGPGAGGSATASAVLGDLIAVAAGAGSSWGGLAPAGMTGPGRVPDVASAEDAARSGWFAFLPSIPPSAITTDLCVQATPVAGGSAIRLRPVPMDQIRAVLRPLVAAGTDPALYPLDV